MGVAIEARGRGQQVWNFAIKLHSLAGSFVFAVRGSVDWFEGGGLRVCVGVDEGRDGV